MIGKAYTTVVPYFDMISKTQKFKSRPCLIIGQADSGDYVILPISTISDKSRIDSEYDIPLRSSAFTFLHHDSYLRTHKQTVVNKASLKTEIADFKLNYVDAYAEALSKVKKFQLTMIANAL